MDAVTDPGGPGSTRNNGGLGGDSPDPQGPRRPVGTVCAGKPSGDFMGIAGG